MPSSGDFRTWAADGDLKAARLKRMQLAALALLLAMAALLLIAVWFRKQVPALAWVQAFAEAAMVGGIADWFAVVALFRRPLGLPLPHTAILAENKERIGAALGRFVEEHFLTPENIVARLDEVDLVGEILRALTDQENGRLIARSIQDVLPKMVVALDTPEIEGVLRRALAAELDRLDADRLMVAVAASLGPVSEDRDAPSKEAGGKRSWFAPVAEVFRAVVASPRQAAGDAYARRLVRYLSGSPEAALRLARFKQALLEQIADSELVSTLLHGMAEQLKATDAPESEVMADRFAEAIAALAEEVLRDAELRARLSADINALIRSALERYGHQISLLITEVIRQWDAREVSTRLEREVGPDLQYIRLNGTVLGGFVGLALHGLLVLLGAA